MERADGYEREKRAARHGAVAERARVAAHDDVPPELLFFLAQDPDPEVRKAVASNRATPPQANNLLARDRNYGVRCALAHKAVGEGLGEEARRDLWRLGFTLLEALAMDQVVRVRKILSQALCSDREAPRPIVLTLANDPEPEVAGPVLERSPVLTESDLSDIAARGTAPWVQAAIAERVRQLDAPREMPSTLGAQARPAHARRKSPKSLETPLDPPTAQKDAAETPEARAARLARDGQLNDEVVSLALASGERAFVTAALALRAGIALHTGRRIVASKSPKAVTALAWKANFPMRFAVDAQRRLAGIAPRSLLYARDGVDYPLTPKEMNWHLGLFAD